MIPNHSGLGFFFEDEPIIGISSPSSLGHPAVVMANLSILGMLSTRVTGNQRRRLEIIDREDYAQVKKKTRDMLQAEGKEVTDDYLDRGILALKQYYAVALLDPANAHAVSAKVDPFWHAHMLYSEQYELFCQHVVGEYMHHRPLDRDNADQMANIRVLYGYTVETLGKLFTDINPEFWPSKVENAELICWHRGNTDLYPDVQEDRLFEPCEAGRSPAFAVA